MKAFLASAAVLAILSANPVMAWGPTTNGLVIMGNACGNCWDSVMFESNPSAHITGCDSNEKTPAEMITCKVEYWRKEVERLQAKKADVEKELTKAQERVSAFTDAQKHP